MSKINYLATGVVDHCTNAKDTNKATEWEKNFNTIYRDRTDNWTYLFKEVCKSLNIDFKKFITVTDKIYKQMGAFDETD